MDVTDSSKNIYETILECQKNGIGAALATVIETKGSTPREVGAKMLVFEDGTTVDTVGGGAIEMFVIKDALEILKEGKPKIVEYSLEEEGKGTQTGMICGGDMKFFIEPVINNPFLYIFGGGHICKFMYKLALMNHFNVIVVDDREEYANSERYPDAMEVIADNYDSAIKKIYFKQPAYVVIMTKSHFSDEIALKNVLKKDVKFKYIGMVASKIKTKEIKEHLLKEGFKKSLIDSVYAPVGLPIKSKTPEEIAVSIMAEIIKVKNS